MKTLQISLTALATAFLLFATPFGQLPLQADNGQILSLEAWDNCPTASFSIVNNGVTAGTPVSFTNQSTGASSYLWDFGDGATSTAVNPSHAYSNAGAYTVKLRAMIDGCTVEFIIVEEVIVN
ncbi:MAG: PKD domain-containing protein [Saprospiraceae bacterium]